MREAYFMDTRVRSYILERDNLCAVVVPGRLATYICK